MGIKHQRRLRAVGVALGLVVHLAGAGLAQQAPTPPPPPLPATTLTPWDTSAPLRSTLPDAVPPQKGNTTVVPRAVTPATPKPAPSAVPPGVGQLRLAAVLTEEGQPIDQGLVWRVFLDGGAADPTNKLVTENRQPSPVLRLPPGDYLINVSFGRSTRTRRLTVKAGEMPLERFVLNAGGLKLAALVGNGQPAATNTVMFDIFADERDQFGNRPKILGGARPGITLRLNSGIYHVVSTYGDANAQVRTDVTVEAGKLTEATVAHAVGRATFKLVMALGTEAIADTQWQITTPQGDLIKESVGALPSHMLMPGNYVVNARSQGRSFRRDFVVQHSETTDVEVLAQ
jgi:hypothetical protein